MQDLDREADLPVRGLQEEARHTAHPASAGKLTAVPEGSGSPCSVRRGSGGAESAAARPGRSLVRVGWTAHAGRACLPRRAVCNTEGGTSSEEGTHTQLNECVIACITGRSTSCVAGGRQCMRSTRDPAAQ